ncbi:MAG: ATP-binding protein [Myxococcaceae bacterium]
MGENSRQALLDALPGPAALLDREGRIVALNAAWSNEASASGSLGPGVTQGFPFLEKNRASADPRAQETAALILRVMSERVPLATTFFGADLEAAHALRVQVLPHSEPSTPVLLLLEDVTLIKRTEAALRASEQRLHLAVEATGDGLFDYDLATGNVTGNARLFEMLGYEPRELAHVSQWRLITHPEDLASTEATLRAHIVGTSPMYQTEVRLRTKAGAWRWILDRGMVVARDGRGRAVRMSGLHTDVTDRKALEEKVRLTGRLAAVGTLSAGLAHEINTPLTALSNSLEVLARQLHPAPEALTLAKDAADAVQKIVKDVRVLSRLEASTARAPTDVAHVVQLAVRLTYAEIQSRAALIQKGSAMPKVMANETRLGQVFTNLLLNAAQAIAPGAPERNEVEVRMGTDSKGRAEIAVRDTGCGIPADVAARIFDPFFTTKPFGVGTGLGLSICHRIVEDLGGELTFESELGKGSTFFVRLPPCEAVTTPRPSSSSDKRKRVLVVDDHRAVGTSLQLLLRAEHDVDVITESEKALEKLARGDLYDLILCDVMMPGMNGMELFAEVSRRAPEAALRFVFMTGGAVRADAKAFLAATTNPVLEKPFPPEALSSMLNASGMKNVKR